MENNQTTKNIERQVAYKMRIIDILNSEYYKTAGEWEPNYILNKNKQKVSRVNFLGAVVFAEDQGNMFTLTIDDGTGKLNARIFDKEKINNTPILGDIVMIIGKPREFNNEIYVMPEIIKTINDKKLVELRRLELQKSSPLSSTEVLEKTKDIDNSKQQIQKEKIIENIDIVDEEVIVNDVDKVINAIRDLDKGSGANIEEIIQKTNQSAEKIIKDLIERGEIFEIKPGQVKLL